MHLLLDFLQQTLLEPQNPYNWHRLFSIWECTDDENPKFQVLNELTNIIFTDSRTEFLRLTFLRNITGNLEYSSRAAKLLLDLKPIIADRTTSFISYNWGFSVKTSTDRSHFIDSINLLHFPALLESLGRLAINELPKQFKRRLPEKIQRVAILAPYVANEFHTPSVLTAQLCSVLNALNVTTQIFSCQEQLILDEHRFTGSNQSIILPDFDPQYWSRILPAGCDLHCSDIRLSLPSRWNTMFTRIDAFDPDLIFFCGFFSPAALALYNYRPVLGINVHSIPILSSVDVQLISDPKEHYLDLNCWYPSFSSSYFHQFPYRLFPIKNSNQIKRADLEIPDNAVVWISVGTRLSEEIRNPWAEPVMSLLLRYPNVFWILVGCTRTPSCLNTISTSRLRILSPSNNVGDLLGIADIYINPNRMGGGFSVAEAMGAELAVVSLRNCDGGNKLGEYASKNIDDFVSNLERLTCDKEQRLLLARSLLDKFNSKLNLKYAGTSLSAALEKSLIVAKNRIIQS